MKRYSEYESSIISNNEMKNINEISEINEYENANSNKNMAP